jgi:hypothetical protein
LGSLLHPQDRQELLRLFDSSSHLIGGDPLGEQQKCWTAMPNDSVKCWQAVLLRIIVKEDIPLTPANITWAIPKDCHFSWKGNRGKLLSSSWRKA